MASFADLSANLKLNILDFSGKLKTASTQVKGFASTINGTAVSGMKDLNKQTLAWGLNMKSISRVVSGILISQAFYKIVQSVQQATSAVWEFSQQLEYAQIAYSNLFGNTELAMEFINVLKDFAAKTPFSFTDSEQAAKRLLAYGIQYKNVMYVMQGVLASASMQGDPAKIEQISRALGQVYTKGRLMNEEMRQLAEAGIPAYEILKEKLGLTQKQLQNLGDEAIPASVAINALVDGMQERFGNVVTASSRTLQGIISNIKDNATMLFAGIFEPFTSFAKSALNELGEFLFAMREIYELKGIGGVFEALFPPEMHEILRQFVANIMNLNQAILRLFYSLGGLLKPVLDALIRVFNAFAPILTLILNLLAGLVHMITSNATAMKVLTALIAGAAAMWVVFKVKALACAIVTGVITAISKALAVLHAVLNFIVMHPFWALLITITGVVVGLSGGFGVLSDKINGLFKQLTQFNGIDPDKVLLPSQKERTNDLDKFNKKLDTTADEMDALADSTGKATKAAKGLLSFDEVFKLNQPDEGTTSGIDTDWLDDFGNIDLSGLGDAFVPEIPDFGSFMDGLKTGFFDGITDLWKDIKDKLASFGIDDLGDILAPLIGAAFGGLLGKLLGGVLGGIIGTIVGGIVGYFWNKLAEYFGLTPEQKARAGVIAGVGAGLGAIFGFILGGPIGAKIGAIVGGLVGAFWGIFAEALGVTPDQHIATLIGGALSGAFQAGLKIFSNLAAGLVPTFTNGVFSGFSKMVGFSFSGALTGALKQGVIGAIAGLATGILANALTAWIAGELNLTDADLKNASTGQIVGNIIGTITGMILGGPAGSLIGGAIGQLAGSVIAEFWAYMNNTLKGTVIGGAAGLPIGALVGVLVGSIGGPLGAAIGAVVGAALGALIGLIIDYWDPISTFFKDAWETISGYASEAMDTFSYLGTAIGALFGPIGIAIGSVIGAFADLKVALSSIDFSALFGNIDFGTFFSTVSETIGSIIENITLFGISLGEVFTGLSTVFSDIGSAVSAVSTDIVTAVTTVATDIWTAVTTVWNDILAAVTTVLSDIWTAVSTVWNDISTAVSTACSAVFGAISEIWNLIVDIIVAVVTKIWDAIVAWFTPIADEIGRVCASIWDAVSTWFTSVFDTISQVVQNIWNTVSTWFMSIFNTISQVVQNIWNTVSTWFMSIFNSIKNIITNIYNTIKTIFTNIWNTIKTIISNVYNTVKTFFISIYNAIKTPIVNAYNTVKGFFTQMYTSVKNAITNMYTNVSSGISNIYNTFTGWISNMWNNVFSKFFTWIADGIAKLREFFGLKESSSEFMTTYQTPATTKTGHATGGIFNREHVARFAEGNKAEAIIPLENGSAMQPFVDAVANGLTASLAPIVANISGGGGSQLQPLYVGTLIADERSLKELERKMEVIRMQESRR